MRPWFKLRRHGALIGALLVLVACQQPQIVAPAVPVNGVGYVFLNAPIAPRSRDLLVAEFNRLAAAGAKDIHFAINSPGGDIDAAQGIVASMTRLHADQGLTFDVYNVGLVASAASYVFLNGQKRHAAPRSAFLFHAAGMVSNGLVPAERLREEADKLDAYERIVRATMKERTKLTDGEAQIYVRRTVLLTPDDARRDGIIDSIETFTIPPGARSSMISTSPAAQPARPAVPPSPN